MRPLVEAGPPTGEAGTTVEEERKPRKVAFVFPGQGTQYVGMGQDLYVHSAAARRVFDIASQILGFDLARLCREGPKEELEKAANMQPAIVTNSLAACEATRAANPNLQPDIAAGHSLGQISAAVASGAIKIEDAIYLAKERGRIVQEYVSEGIGGMAAFLGASLEAIEEICRRTGTFLANHNSPGQVVISGLTENLERAKALARDAGVRKIIPLAVGRRPFHSPHMADAETEFGTVVGKIKVADPKIPFIPNERGVVCFLGEEIRASLAGGLTGPVKWAESVLSMIREGVEITYEFGGSRDGVLAGLIRRINPEIKTKVINSVPSLQLSLSES